MTLLRNNSGQGLVEYLIIMALMAVASMAILRVLNQTVNVKFAQVTEALQGRRSSQNFQVETIQLDDVKKKDMSDFFHGTRTGHLNER